MRGKVSYVAKVAILIQKTMNPCWSKICSMNPYVVPMRSAIIQLYNPCCPCMSISIVYI